MDNNQHERVALLVEVVGGPGRAAKIAGVSRATIVNWRKKGASLPLDGMLALALAGGVSLDWIATGEQVRPDLVGAETDAAAFADNPSLLVRLIDVRIRVALDGRTDPQAA